jgi:hypothetical protein
MKIVNRESISPDHENKFQNPLLLENEIKGLFQPYSVETASTPYRALFTNNNPLNFNSFIPNNEGRVDPFSKIKPSNNFFQTPKGNKVLDQSLFFSPETNREFQTPQAKVIHSGKFFRITIDNYLSLKSMGLTTPKGIRHISEFNSNRLNQSTIDEFSTEDFQNKLIINPSSVLRDNTSTNISYSTDFTNKYTLLSGKNRVGRLVSTHK